MSYYRLVVEKFFDTKEEYKGDDVFDAFSVLSRIWVEIISDYCLDRVKIYIETYKNEEQINRQLVNPYISILFEDDIFVTYEDELIFHPIEHGGIYSESILSFGPFSGLNNIKSYLSSLTYAIDLRYVGFGFNTNSNICRIQPRTVIDDSPSGDIDLDKFEEEMDGINADLNSHDFRLKRPPKGHNTIDFDRSEEFKGKMGIVERGYKKNKYKEIIVPRLKIWIWFDHERMNIQPIY